MALQRTLLEHDGKSTAILEAAAREHRDDARAAAAAIVLLDSPEGHAATAASWVLKHWLAAGRVLTETEVEDMATRLQRIGSHWAALHLCQSMRFLDVPPASAPAFRTFLEACSRSERPFLRAWGTDGLVRFSARYPEVERLAKRRLEAALSDPAPSVRARARGLLREVSAAGG